MVTAGGLGMQPKLLTEGAAACTAADVGDGSSMEGVEAAKGGEEWACEGVEGEEICGATFRLRVGEKGSVRRAITWR
jgi:hypothetical protein